MQSVKIHLSLSSLLKLAIILGMGYSIVSLILFALVTIIRGNIAALDSGREILQLIGAAFSQGLLLPIIVTLLGYPLFWWWNRRNDGVSLAGVIHQSQQ